MDCDKLKPSRVGRCSIAPQAGDRLYQLKIKLKNVATAYQRTRKFFSLILEVM